MEFLLENWNKYLNEEEMAYEMEIAVRAEPKTQIYGVIFDKIRAIEGITIIKSTSLVTKDSVGNKYLKINIKFIMHPTKGIRFLDILRNKVRGMTDPEGDKITSVRITRMPKRTEK